MNKSVLNVLNVRRSSAGKFPSNQSIKSFQARPCLEMKSNSTMLQDATNQNAEAIQNAQSDFTVHLNQPIRMLSKRLGIHPPRSL